MIMFYSVNRCIQIAYITLILVHARYVFVYTKTLATAELSFYHSIFRVEKSYKRFNEGDFFRKYDVFFLFSGTKVTPHSVFVKGRFTLRVKNLLSSLRSCGIFYPSPLTNLHASLAVV